MITLDDARNRNYYFYQGSGEIRVEFLKQVFEVFLGYEYRSFIYNRAEGLIKKGWKKSEAYEKARHQAVETALRACEALPKYREEVIKKFQENPGLRGGITDEQINKMKYNDLSTLRTNLGLNRRGKKVQKQETAPTKTVEQAKEALKKESTAKTAAEIIKGSTQATLEDLYPEVFNPPHHETEEFYTVEEARKAYPGYSYEELIKEGIHLVETDAKERLEQYQIIDQIIMYNISIDGLELSEEKLVDCNLEELKKILTSIRKLQKLTKGRTK